ADIDADVSLLSDNNGNYPVGTVPPQAPNNAVVRNYKKWPELGVFISSNSFFDPQGRWIEDVKLMKGWLTARLNWMDSQFMPEPLLSPGGNFASPTQVTMTPRAQATTSDTQLLAAGAPVRWIVPTSGTAASLLGWQNPSFNAALWTAANTGIGYDTQTSPVNF